MPEAEVRAPGGRRVAAGAALAFGAVIAVLTLTPSGETTTSGLAGCLVCGSRGAADAILNVALFTPLGVALHLAGWSIRASFVLALLFSGGIELVQIVVPGRDPSWGDVVFNVAGVVVGAALPRPVARLAAPPDRWRWPLAVGAASMFVAHAVALSLLLRPAFPDRGWYGQLTPELPRLETYRGRVESARIGEIPLEIGRLARPSGMKAALLAGEPLRARVVTGTPPPAFAPVVAVATGAGVHLFLLGVDGADLVLRVRTNAGDLRLSEPETRWPGALADLPPGRGVELGMRAAASGWCLGLDGEERCELGPTVGSGWNLLIQPTGLPAPLHRGLSVVWVGLLAVAAGWWVGRSPGRAALAGAAIGAGAWLVPLTSDWLAPTPPHQWLAAGLGLGLGAVTGRAFGTVTRRTAARTPTDGGTPVDGVGRG